MPKPDLHAEPAADAPGAASLRYQAQHRGDGGAYQRYLDAMDGSMRQKVALTAAHLLALGTVADMGMGSGTGSHALAALYPGLDVVGVDVNPEVVRRAEARYHMPNLRFVAGDIATPVFAPGSLQGVLNSSVLHHVTSFNGYNRGAAAEALRVQAGALATGGVLVVRDFLDPGGEVLLLDLPDDDGAGPGPLNESTAALLVRFSREFRKLSDAPGFPLEETTDGPPLPPGWRRFRLPATLAAEFILRKDYREDWDSEVLEEYTYLTQAGFEAVFAALGLRVLASTPLYNPWIIRNRLEGRVRLFQRDGREAELPPTNYVIVGEKAPADEGVRFAPAVPCAPAGFLAMHHYRDRRSGQVRDLVARPHPTVDVIPFFELAGDVFVLARSGYPRPILSVGPARIDGSRPPVYVIEPLAVQQGGEPLGLTVERALGRAAGVAPGQIRRFLPGAVYTPSPGGVQEEVRSALVEVDPVFASQGTEALSGLSTSGRLRALEAQQLLRAAAVGGLPDARLELNVYELLAQLGRSPGPWIGEAIALAAAGTAPPTALSALAARPARRVFAEVGAEHSPGFLGLKAAIFRELDAAGREVARAAREYVEPAQRSAQTVVAALLARGPDGAPLLGVDDDDLPAVQSFTGNSQVLVAPAWRLPHGMVGRAASRRWIEEKIREEYGVSVADFAELGGCYHPSAGSTPEVVFPLAVLVSTLQADAARPLSWVPLVELVAGRAALLDGHLRIVVSRLGHALGLW